MSKGKIASQVGHVVQLITEEIIRSAYEQHPVPASYFSYMKWKTNCKKIVLKATTEQLKILMQQKEARHIIDNGKTQVPSNSLAVVGFYPSSTLSELVSDYKLL